MTSNKNLGPPSCADPGSTESIGLKIEAVGSAIYKTGPDILSITAPAPYGDAAIAALSSRITGSERPTEESIRRTPADLGIETID